MSAFELKEEQIERYSRHILLSEIGGEGQRRLLNSSAFVVGAGGLESPALLYLAAAGVGRLGIADNGRVDLSNLHRQIVHETEDVGRSKVLSAYEAIRKLNPDCEVNVFPHRLTAENIKGAILGYDIVLDGSDNFPTRFLVADCCWLENIPLVSAAVVQVDGQLMAVLPGQGNPCYRCFVAKPPPPGLTPTCQEVGVLGAAAGVMGTLQAVEALKVLLGLGDVLSHHLLVYDALECSFNLVEREQNPRCSLCGSNPSITELMEHDEICIGSRDVRGEKSRQWTEL